MAALRDAATARVDDLAAGAGLLSLSSNIPDPGGPRDPTTDPALFSCPDLGVGEQPQRFEVPADIEPGLWVLCPDDSDLVCIVIGVGPDAASDLERCEVCRIAGLGGSAAREDLSSSNSSHRSDEQVAATVEWEELRRRCRRTRVTRAAVLVGERSGVRESERTSTDGERRGNHDHP